MYSSTYILSLSVCGAGTGFVQPLRTQSSPDFVFGDEELQLIAVHLGCSSQDL